MTTLQRILQAASPLTNISSRRFPLARIRGASLKQRFHQTNEILGGQYYTYNGRPAHMGVLHFALAIPALLFGFQKSFEVIASFDQKTRKIAYPISIAFKLLADAAELFVIKPLAFLLTVLSTPAILFTHLVYTLSKPDLFGVVTTEQDLAELETKQYEQKAFPSTGHQLTTTRVGMSYSSIRLRLSCDNDKVKEAVLEFDTKEPWQKDRIKQILDYDSFGVVSCIEAGLFSKDFDKESVDDMIASVYKPSISAY